MTVNPYLYPILKRNKDYADKHKPGAYRLSEIVINREVGAICKVLDIKKEILLSKSRKRGTVFARKIICYLFKYRHPVKSVANIVGFVDHSTVIYHQQDVEGKLKIKDKLIIETLRNIKNEIERIEASELR